MSYRCTYGMTTNVFIAPELAHLIFSPHSFLGVSFIYVRDSNVFCMICDNVPVVGMLVNLMRGLLKYLRCWPFLCRKGVDQAVLMQSSVTHCVNSLAPGRSECDSKNVIFILVLLNGIFRSSHDNALRWMPQDLTDDKSTLVQVMAWCRQATSHYLSQCWLSSLSPDGVARPHC